MGEHTGTEQRRRPATRSATRRLAVGLSLVLVVAAGCSSSDDAASPSTQPSDPSGAAADSGAPSAITAEAVADSIPTLDAIVEQVMDETGVPGVAVAVVHDDAVVYQQGYGVRDTDGDDPVTPETVFQIASLSKPVSATVMAGLVGDGVFAWDDPIADHAPELALSDPWVSERVTFADLFAHRSGLPGATAGNDLEAVGYDRATILERLQLVPLQPFRSTYSYSNFGMTMAGEAAAVAAGTTWEDVADEVLFEPAGMTSTSMRHDDLLARDDRASLHVERDGEWVSDFERVPDAQAPAGGVSSNVVDLARWLRLTLADGALDGEQIIDPDALDEIHTPQIRSRPPAPTIGDPAAFYGLGWGIETDAAGAVRWNHSGAFSLGAATVVVAVPSEGLGIVVLTNAAPIGAPEAIADSYLQALRTGDPDVEGNLELWSGRFANVYGEPDLDPTQRPDDPAPARDLDAYVGTYANDYVGEVEIRTAGDDLELVVGPDDMVFALEHWDGDTFAYADAPELPDFLSSVVFAVGDDGQATEVTIAAFDGAGLGALPRT